MKIPLSLSVYEHAAKVIDRSPWEVSRDEDLFYEAHKAAFERYGHFPLIVGIDIYNLEAEAYGSAITRPDENGTPSIKVPVLTDIGQFTSLKREGFEKRGRIDMAIRIGQRLRKAFPDADVRIPIGGPFSVAQCLFGLENLVMSAITDPDLTKDALSFIADGQQTLVKKVTESGLAVAFFESAAAPPLLSPKSFKEVELPVLKKLMKDIEKITGSPVPCIIGGDTCPIIDEMVETGTNFLICPAETDKQAFVEKMKQYPEVAVRINMNPRTYAYGTREEIESEIDSILKLAQTRSKVLLGTGAIPYETPVENILTIKKYVEEE